MTKKFLTKHKAKLLVLAVLILANATYPMHNFFGWLLTLGFFLFVPGQLLLTLLKHRIKSRWVTGIFSMAISMLILMVSGLALNTSHALGVARPLTTLNIFVTLDIVTIMLLVFSKSKRLALPPLKFRATTEQIIVTLALTLLPLLGAGGAIRLNNGASNVLTMILFAAITLLFILLIWRSKALKSLYPYAAFTMALSVLFSISLRGWLITANDIHHEFAVFTGTLHNSYWSPNGDPYNACLSLNILPTILAKITSIQPSYIYKALYQIFFALGVVPIYFVAKKLSNAQLGLTGALIFISFPPFVNGMPYENRQEIAFIYFALLILTTFLDMPSKAKTLLTVFSLIGITFSHYSSGYVALSALLLAWVIFKVLRHSIHRKSAWQPFTMPVLSLPIIIAALLFTFLWNMQLTHSSSNLSSTVTQTIKGLWNGSASQANGVNYALISPKTLSPSQVLANYAGKNADQIHVAPPEELPTTRVGNSISHFVSVSTLNSIIRALSAKLLQILLFVGAIFLFFVQKKKSSAKETYFFALTIASIILLIMITVLPQLSIGYGVTRLFQQLLAITALPIIMGAELIFGFLKQYKTYAVALLFAFMFLDLSGFVPQATGGYPPQLALNNWGTDYDIYYIHRSEVTSADWLAANDPNKAVAADFYAKSRLQDASVGGKFMDVINSSTSSTYLYQGFATVHFSLYDTFLGGDVIEYSYPSAINNHDRVYSNQSSRIYRLPSALTRAGNN